MHHGQYEAAIGLMKALRVLPNEGASQGRNVWRETHLYAAIDALEIEDYATAAEYIRSARDWPENIGVGRPYDVDERLEDLLAWYCERAQGKDGESYEESIIAFRNRYPQRPAGSGDLVSLMMLRLRGGYEGTSVTDDGGTAWATP
ncbi:hypothetical protein ACQ86N_00410 [Puia sp. P3]|uniref:hypothetical protein n=1 Tax=Puia sp. P3 TaxID=3423952 RepID=UPI003D67D052